jgi:hypothetical protein
MTARIVTCPYNKIYGKDGRYGSHLHRGHVLLDFDVADLVAVVKRLKRCEAELQRLGVVIED